MPRWFAERVVAALTYDKRGAGESSGDFRQVPFTELCGDGLAAVELLKERKEVNRRQIGVWGISQGGGSDPWRQPGRRTGVCHRGVRTGCLSD